MKLSAVVVEYRTDYIKSFIDSWIKHAPDWADLTVVDQDPTVPILGQDVPGRLITTGENLGYGRALNRGIAGSDADVFAFFNSDIILCENTIQDCATALMENDDWGILGPYQYDTKGLVTHGGILGTLKAPYQRGWHKPKSDIYKEVRDDAVFPMGSAFFVKRECWDELNACPIYQEVCPGSVGFPEQIFLYYEETLLSYHGHAHGWKSVYYGLAECVHHWHGTINKYGDQGAFKESQKVFRTFCDAHNLEHD